MSDKQKVFQALRNPEWDWRTLEGIRKDTGLSENQIFHVLLSHISKIEMRQSGGYGLLFRLKVRDQKKEEPFLDKALDYLTLGKRKNVA